MSHIPRHTDLVRATAVLLFVVAKLTGVLSNYAWWIFPLVVGFEIVPGTIVCLVRICLSKRQRPRVARVPGSRIRCILSWVYSEKSMKRIFEPALADMLNDWLKAILEGRKWKAWWVRIRGYHSIYSAAGLHVVVSAGRKLLSIWKVT